MYRQVGNKNKAPLSKIKYVAMLATYKKDNPHITKAYIWLDGAGNLHNAGLLAVFADSEAHTGIRVLEVNHNEGARSQVAGPLATVART